MRSSHTFAALHCRRSRLETKRCDAMRCDAQCVCCVEWLRRCSSFAFTTLCNAPKLRTLAASPAYCWARHLIFFLLIILVSLHPLLRLHPISSDLPCLCSGSACGGLSRAQSLSVRIRVAAASHERRATPAAALRAFHNFSQLHISEWAPALMRPTISWTRCCSGATAIAAAAALRHHAELRVDRAPFVLMDTLATAAPARRRLQGS